MNEIIFIADFFTDQVLGGGELNNEELIQILIQKGHRVLKVNSHRVTPKLIESHKDSCFIVANFVNMPAESRESLSNKRYIIYEHDHKYLRSRNPATYEDFKAPSHELVNLDFYRSANRVLCQSQYHKDIVYNNTKLTNLVNLSGNLWPEHALKLMSELSKAEKADRCSVMNSNIPHKNTYQACRFCEFKNLEYELINSDSYEDFLRKLSRNKRFAFFPKTPETLSRVAVEARMMNVTVIVNNLIGAAREPWFRLKGDELIEVVREMRARIPLTVMESFEQ